MTRLLPFFLLVLAACGGESTQGARDTVGPGVDALAAETDGGGTEALEVGGKDQATGEGTVDTPGEDQAPTDQTVAPGTWTDNGDGTVSDGRTGLTWQKKALSVYVDWQTASDACLKLSLAGQDDWRLPSIDELRTLLTGCPPTMPNGNCDVIHGCVECWNDSCKGCDDWQGPGADGCYIDPVLEGNCSFYWTSSSLNDDPIYTWGVAFYSGKVVGRDKVASNPYRCVRDEF